MDKNKIFQTATRLAQRGQIDRAIAEYQRLVKHDPNEVRALLKIGELLQRKGENEEAARALEKAAESYATQGFFLKAVAVYKQILKLDPRVEAHQRLADLYQQLGLLREAMSQLQIVIATYEKEGRTNETISILRKMLDLEPENALARARLGELLLAAGETKEGREEIGRALAQLEEGGRSDDYLRVADRLLGGEDPDPEIARKVAKIYLDKGEARRALGRLQISFKADPTSVETLKLLASAFQEIGDTKKTVSVYRELARLHKEAGRSREEREAWKQVLRLAPDDAAAREALSKTPDASKAPSRPPTPPPLTTPEAIPVPDARRAPAKEPTPAPMPAPSASPAAKPPPVPSSPPPARPEDASRLLAELDVYLKYKLYPKAKDHLAALLALDPDVLDVQERAVQVAEGTGDREGMRAALVAVVRLARQAKEEERAQRALSRLASEFPGDPEVEALGTAEPISVSEMIVVDDVPAAGDEVVLAVSLDEPLEKGPAEPELATSPSGLGDEDSALRAALEVSILEEGDETFHEPLLEEEPPAAPAAPEPPTPPAASKPQAPPASDPSLDADLEELDFYWRMEMFEEAEELLRSILERAPGHPVATARLAELEARREPPAPTPRPAAAAPEPSARAPEPSPTPATPPPPAETTPAPRAADGPRKPPPPAFAKALTVVPDEEGTFDLAEELLGDLDLADEAPQAEPADFQYSVEEVLAEFKKGVSQVVRPEDSETHYNLGIAYKEMGLYTEAIGAFQQAMLGCKGTQREVDCMITAGLCHADMGDHAAAIEWFRSGLGAAAVTAESALALHYEIGVSYEALGEREKAVEHFSRVHRADPGYRDVAAALERLRNDGDNPSQPSSLNKGKVGYV